jgi:hypothetical protein
LTSAFLQTLNLSSDVGDLDRNEEEDDFVSKSMKPVGWNDMIVNIDLAIQGCNEILQNANDIVLFRQGNSKYTFLGWIRSLNSFVSELPEDQIVFLLDIMIKTKKVTIQEDILVFGPYDDIRIALFRLQVTLETMETRLQNWSNQRDNLVIQAINFKKQNRLTLAKSALQRKVKYDHFIDQTYQIVLNLELTQQALTMAQSQVEVLPLLNESSSVYKSLRKDGMTLEQVDNLILEWTEEVENLERAHKTFEASTRDYEEDILCGELESLMLNDNCKDSSLDMRQDAKPTEPSPDDAALKSLQMKAELHISLPIIDQGTNKLSKSTDTLMENSIIDLPMIEGDNVTATREIEDKNQVKEACQPNGSI